MREIQRDELEPLATGAWILGAGGGGNPYLSYVNLCRLYDEGARVVAVASRPAPGTSSLGPDTERGLVLRGFLAFTDAVKPGARESLDRLAELGVDVKITTGDGAVVAERLWAQLGRQNGGTLDGDAVDALGDPELAEAARAASIFAFRRRRPSAKSGRGCVLRK